MDPQRFFYRVLRLNGDHTTLKFSDDILKFDIKVLYQSLNTYPRRLQYCFPSQSILRNNFFQEGQNFLHALLSRTHFSIDSLEEITESVASTVRELFEVGDRVASEHRLRDNPCSVAEQRRIVVSAWRSWIGMLRASQRHAIICFICNAFCLGCKSSMFVHFVVTFCPPSQIDQLSEEKKVE
ncbi:unnamed protein product [Sphenostylis stenocarpa]|uniref:Uncharacterized protein n=1 Tax=Sphenostylis stenocarpa TaxID=92480 RepID=A0AA86VVY0_9FABA|nr:unnamed protein product [Sphenostylis stenocarpa]